MVLGENPTILGIGGLHDVDSTSGMWRHEKTITKRNGSEAKHTLIDNGQTSVFFWCQTWWCDQSWYWISNKNMSIWK